MNARYLLVAGLSGVLALGACSDASPVAVETLDATADARPETRPEKSNGAPRKGDASIGQLAGDLGFGELVGALSYVDTELGTGLVDLFTNGTAQYTVFAPTNAAFEALYAQLSIVLSDVTGSEVVVDEIEDVPASVVRDVLFYHVTRGRRAANSVVPRNGERTIETLLGETFAVQTDLTIEDGLSPLDIRPDATIETPNVSASNGIVHGITQVIVPPSVVAALTS